MSLAKFQRFLETGYEAECVLLHATGWNDLPGLEALDDCDVALFFTRRLKIEGEQLDRVKGYIEAGRPFVGVRTASHGFQNWLAFDKKVLGGDYQGHFGNGPTTGVRLRASRKEHPILKGVVEFRSRGSLYKNPGVANDVDVLLRGSTRDGREPVAWTREYKGGRLFYTSLGAQGDFDNRTFMRMLANALFWTARKPLAPKPLPPLPDFPKATGDIRFSARTRDATQDAPAQTLDVTLDVAKTAIVLCDLWDLHWCRGASARVDAMAPRVDEVLSAAREAGVQIVHAPSDTLYAYVDSVQRRRAQAAPTAPKPPEKVVDEPPLPIDDSDGGCDTEGDESYSAWTRQHPAVAIGEADVISDNGDEVYNFLVRRGIDNIVFMGVHTNMCVLGRSFAIRNMTRWGIECYLVRDLTDAMYDPNDRPFVSHDEGTALVVEHIEKYWCPSLLSEDLLAGLP